MVGKKHLYEKEVLLPEWKKNKAQRTGDCLSLDQGLFSSCETSE